MQKRIYSWLDREFIELSGEARAAASVEDETNDLFRRFEQELKGHGLSCKTRYEHAYGARTEKRELSLPPRAPRFLPAMLKRQAQVTFRRLGSTPTRE